MHCPFGGDQISISWPDWISAISTGAAFVATLYLIRRDRRDAKAAAARAQAEQVTCWYEASSAGTAIANFTGHVINRSAEPIFDVSVSGARSQGVDWTMAVIAPSSDTKFALHAVEGWTGDLARTGSIEFTDARGTRWNRRGADLKQVVRA